MSVMKTILTTVLIAFATAVAAQDSDSVELITKVQKQVVVQTDDGENETRLVAADNVLPGERLIVTTTVRNIGAEPAGNIVITNPIQNELQYVAGSAAGDDMQVQFSIDGGQTFAAASQLRVVDNGDERPATTKDYTHVRWIMQTELAAGAEGQATFAADVQ